LTGRLRVNKMVQGWISVDILGFFNTRRHLDSIANVNDLIGQK
jgi:hypothetical protein